MDWPAIKDTLTQFITALEPEKWLIAYFVLLIPVIISWRRGLELHGELIKTSLRATFQLILIAVILVPILNLPPFTHYLLIAAMIVLGAGIAHERGKKIKHSFWIALFASLFTYLITITVFVISGSLDVAPNVLIPISGMLIGNIVRSIGLSYHKAVDDFEAYQSTLEAMLIDGADIKYALKIPANITLKNAMIPRIDSLKTLGIVHIPGAMAGMLVAGADPLTAAGYQILIFFGIVSTSAFSTIISNTLAYKSIFSSRYPHLIDLKTADN